MENVQEGKRHQKKGTSSCFCLCPFCFWGEVSATMFQFSIIILDWEFTELGYSLRTNCTSLPDTPFLNYMYVLRTLKSVAAPSFRAGHIWQTKGD